MSKLPSRLATACSAVLAAATLMAPGPANATSSSVKVYSYAVKFLCEEEEGNSLETAINIHNPSLTQSATIKWKIVIPGYSPYFFQPISLGPDRAASEECETVFDPQAPTVAPAEESFIILLSLKPLDVVAVYEVEHTGDVEELEDIELERVPGVTQTVPWNVWNNLGNNPN